MILWHLTRCEQHAGITTFNTHYITPALVGCLRGLVVGALRRRRGGVGSVPAGGPIVDDVFLNCSWLEFRQVATKLPISSKYNKSVKIRGRLYKKVIKVNYD